MNHVYTDLSESRLLSGYASQIVEAIQNDESAPHLYDDIREMLQQVSPSGMITIGNPAITAPASWWGDWFGLNLTAEDIAELKEICL
ncbi:hypothetical protein ACVQEP_20240 [Enterobacter mori]|uniref:hypothetical protein n=1 Tax=Enterobacteriaceae TaxID=543 RepID=UPI000F848313|nr:MULTISPECIES: hypothetical protein [Enterobacteriaceae]HCM9743066.1 hypothetical protein [Enterobacter hormaechei subsp. steigerwaltii]HDT2790166.1 hypothetical protein [Enterobacter asburiae]EFB1447135.1 hypothetical protein [Escherichia coli]EKG2069874.1 hypothetical protein [Escherichia coli]MCI3663227.1 hypothetical protein [Escherichia coli]